VTQTGRSDQPGTTIFRNADGVHAVDENSPGIVYKYGSDRLFSIEDTSSERNNSPQVVTFPSIKVSEYHVIVG
jgi:hypothetical protein